MTAVRRWMAIILLGICAVTATAMAQLGTYGQAYRTDLPYDGRFTFVRLRWEWSGEGLYLFDASNEAYKLGVNYVVYGLTR